MRTTILILLAILVSSCTSPVEVELESRVRVIASDIEEN